LGGLVLFIHIVVCIFLVIIVLLQSGKGADLAGAFGMSGSQSAFGPRGTATFLSKMTTTLAVLFMVTSLVLWIIGSKKEGPKSIITEDDVKQMETTKGKGTPTIPPVKPAQTPAKSESGSGEKTEQGNQPGNPK